MKTILSLLEFPETVISMVFISFAILGLSEAFAARGIDPRTMQVAGIAWIFILAVKLVLKAFDFQGREL